MDVPAFLRCPGFPRLSGFPAFLPEIWMSRLSALALYNSNSNCTDDWDYPAAAVDKGIVIID